MALVSEDFPISSPWILIVSGLISWYVLTAVVSWYRLRHIPGPFLAKFSHWWLARVASSGKQWDYYHDFNERYKSSLVRVGPNELTTDDPEIIRKMSAVRGAYGRDEWYLAARFDPYHDNIFTLLKPETHDKLKARTAVAYGGKETPALEPGVDDQVTEMIDLIRKKYVSNPNEANPRLLEFAQLTSFFTMDVITRSAFGKEFGYLKTDSDRHNFLKEVRDNWPKLAITVDVPWIRNILYSPGFLKFFGPKTTDAEGMGKCMGIARELVGKRFAPDSKPEKDMLGSFIAHGLTQQECATEGLFMIIAGSDTTASAIRVTMLYILSSPRIYHRLKGVIAEAISSGKVSKPISSEQAREIPYLQAVIYEGLRTRPPAPGLYSKSVPPEGDTLNGIFVPGGTAIGMNTSAILRSKDLFGADADIFRPERFLEADDATRAEMQRNVELIFGYGRYMCAGKPVAFMELNKIFFELLREFDFQLANPTKPWDSQSFSVFVETNMWVKVTEASKA